jgi:hypothetical protein
VAILKKLIAPSYQLNRLILGSYKSKSEPVLCSSNKYEKYPLMGIDALDYFMILCGA